jgi:hypothetical protein
LPLDALMSFYLFLIAIALYAGFVFWCLAALIRSEEIGPIYWVRFGIGLLLISPNFFPPLTFLFATGAVKADAVTFFPYTAPKYIANVVKNITGEATVINVTVSIQISGVRYAPVLKLACSERSAVSFDKGDIHSFAGFPTISHGQIAARVGNDVLAISFDKNLCALALRGKLAVGILPGRPEWAGELPKINVIRDSPNHATVYRLHWDGQPLVVDDIALLSVEITKISTEPANNIVDWGELWPVVDRSDRDTDIVQDYRAVSRTAGECVSFVDVRFNRGINASIATLSRGPTSEDVRNPRTHGFDRGYLKLDGPGSQSLLRKKSETGLPSCDAYLQKIKGPEEELVPSHI